MLMLHLFPNAFAVATCDFGSRHVCFPYDKIINRDTSKLANDTMGKHTDDIITRYRDTLTAKLKFQYDVINSPTQDQISVSPLSLIVTG